MQLSAQQKFNQALIQMAVLLYQVDKKVTLTEQDALDEMIEKLTWESPISLEAFKTEAIFIARRALDEGEGENLLRSLNEDLLYDADAALEAACFITGVDGERSEEEVEYLHLLTHKLLAKALTSTSEDSE
jgi:tellurite resistance protein